MLTQLYNMGEKTWNILLVQAPITGTVQLFTLFILFMINAIMIRYLVKSTSQDGDTSTLSDDSQAMLFWATLVLTIINLIVLFGTLPGAINAILHPEYWALQQLLDTAREIRR